MLKDTGPLTSNRFWRSRMSLTFDQLQQALQVFGLSERATLEEIKFRHRQLVKQHHPDHNPLRDPEGIRRVNAAYRVLSTYCRGYRFSFSREEFLEQHPEERLREQFSGDPVWGGDGSGS